MAALTKASIAEHLFSTIGLNKKESMLLIEAFFEEIKKVLESGEEVRLSGFGNFVLKDKKERPGRNPMTGESAIISARRVVSFHPGKKLRGKVEKYVGEKAE